MPRKIRQNYKGISFTVVPDKGAGIYHLEFQIGDQTFRAKAETKLPEMAVRRARTAIDRRLKQLQASNE
jgi:hypothetical protein